MQKKTKINDFEKMMQMKKIFEVMVRIYKDSNNQGYTLYSTISGLVGPANCTICTKKLENYGYINRHFHYDDKEEKLIIYFTITKKGIQICHYFMCKWI